MRATWPSPSPHGPGQHHAEAGETDVIERLAQVGTDGFVALVTRRTNETELYARYRGEATAAIDAVRLIRGLAMRTRRAKTRAG